MRWWEPTLPAKVALVVFVAWWVVCFLAYVTDNWRSIVPSSAAAPPL